MNADDQEYLLKAKDEVVGIAIISGDNCTVSVKKEEVITAFSAGMKLAVVTRLNAIHLYESFRLPIWKDLMGSKTLFCINGKSDKIIKEVRHDREKKPEQ